jgi:phospholipid/cholesterol/gamma-HCH transport system permease protein
MLGKIGAGTRHFVDMTFELLGMLSVTVRESYHFKIPARRRMFWFLFKRQLYNSGFKAAYINALIATILGWLLITISMGLLPSGVDFIDYYARIFYIVSIREIGPLVSGIILISRSATAVTAELGHTKLKGEFDVVSANRMSPVFLFCLPVFYAFPLSLLMMFFYFNVVCVLSSYVFLLIFTDVGGLLSINQYLSTIVEKITAIELLTSMGKAALGGLLIGMISVFFAMKVNDKYTDISRAISASSTTQLFVFFLINVTFSYMAYR